MENFTFREAVKWGLKIFAPNYQKAHPYANLVEQIVWRIRYVAVTLFRHYTTATRKKVRENCHGKIELSIKLRRYRDVVIIKM